MARAATEAEPIASAPLMRTPDPDVTRETPKGKRVDAPSAMAIPIARIEVATNVRTDIGDLEELAASIRELGILQPIIVTRATDDQGNVLEETPYRVLLGHRRLAAATLAGYETVPAIFDHRSEVGRPGPRRSIEQLSENLQRADLNPMDEAHALREVLDADPKLTQEALADKLGRSRPWVSNSLRLLHVDETVQAKVAAGEISATHARAIATLPAEKQRRLADRAARDKLSTRDIEQTVQWHESEVAAAESKAKRTERVGPKVVAALEKADIAKDARLYVTGGYEIDVDAIVKRIRAAGWKKVDKQYLYGGRPAGCDCTAVRVEISGRGAGIIPACDNDEHREAQGKADRVQREAEDRAEQEQLLALHRTVIESLTITTPDTAIMRLLAFSLQRSGGSFTTWQDVAGLDDAELIARIGKRLTDRWLLRGVDVGKVLDELGADAPRGPAPVEALLAAGVDVDAHDDASPGRLARGMCSVCGRDVALRKGGLVREHRAPGDGENDPVCSGSGVAAA